MQRKSSSKKKASKPEAVVDRSCRQKQISPELRDCQSEEAYFSSSDGKQAQSAHKVHALIFTQSMTNSVRRPPN